jgi:hypothetical protein
LSGRDDLVELALCGVVWGSGVGVANPSRTSIGMEITKALHVATERCVRRLVTGGGPSLGPSNHAWEGNEGSQGRSR